VQEDDIEVQEEAVVINWWWNISSCTLQKS